MVKSVKYMMGFNFRHISASVITAALVLSLAACTQGVPATGSQSTAQVAARTNAKAATESYSVMARFDNIGAIRLDSPVTASGVVIGRVAAIEYDNETYEAVVSLSINTKYNRFPLDTAASVLTYGLAGGQYIDLQPGAEEAMLQDGDSIELTQSALILEQVIGQFIYNQANDSPPLPASEDLAR